MANPISPSNAPVVMDADISIDVSGDHDFAVAIDLKPTTSQLSTSGGDFPSQPTPTWDGPIAGVGLQNETVVTVDAVYTDGETNDAWETLIAAKGQPAAIRWWPKGETTGNRYHTVTGRLNQVQQPTAGTGNFTYQIVISGTESSGTEA